MKRFKTTMLLLIIASNLTTVYGQWSLTGNASTSPPTNFLGTTDANKLVLKVNNQISGHIDYDVNIANTGFGYKSLSSLSSGYYNTAIGYEALLNNTIGYTISALGLWSLRSNSPGPDNTSIGQHAL